jgi:hypothetical protein
VFAGLLLTGCYGHDAVIGKSAHPDGASAPVQFAFDSLDVRPVSTATVIGKPTVVSFVTTWDLSSQAQVDFLVPMSKRDRSAVNYLMVAVQEPQDREMIQVFTSHLHVDFPVAIVEKDNIDGGPFGEIKAVPTTIILDRSARMVWRHVGLARPEEIRAGLAGL